MPQTSKGPPALPSEQTQAKGQSGSSETDETEPALAWALLTVKGAEKALAEYIAQKNQPPRERGRDPDQVRVAVVVANGRGRGSPLDQAPEETAETAGDLRTLRPDASL
jgi:hypothetical protein